MLVVDMNQHHHVLPKYGCPEKDHFKISKILLLYFFFLELLFMLEKFDFFPRIL
jgi:hypothetical protein